MDHDDTDDIRWLTYAELGQARGISTASATRLSFRRKWRRQPGNDGAVRVAVPVGDTLPRAGNSHDATDDAGDDDRDDIARIVSGFDAALAALREQLTASDQRADRAEARADRAEQALAAERAQTDKLRDQLDAAEASAEQAEARGDRAQVELERARAAGREALQAAEALRQAEIERRAMGLLARLLAALRG